MDFVIRISNKTGFERTWTSKLSSPHDTPPDFRVSEPTIVGDWVMLDIWVTPETTVLDWRAVLVAHAGSSDGVQNEKAPSTGWYRVRASLGSSPRLSVGEGLE